MIHKGSWKPNVEYHTKRKVSVTIWGCATNTGSKISFTPGIALNSYKIHELVNEWVDWVWMVYDWVTFSWQIGIRVGPLSSSQWHIPTQTKSEYPHPKYYNWYLITNRSCFPYKYLWSTSLLKSENKTPSFVVQQGVRMYLIWLANKECAQWNKVLSPKLPYGQKKKKKRLVSDTFCNKCYAKCLPHQKKKKKRWAMQNVGIFLYCVFGPGLKIQGG